MAKRSNGEGSIYERGDHWEGKVTTGRDPETGKLKRVTFRARTKEEIIVKVNETLVQLRHGTFIEPARVTLREWFHEWLNEYKKPELKTRTFSSYEETINKHIIPHIGHIRLQALRPEQLQRLYNDKARNGRLDSKGAFPPAPSGISIP